MVVLIGGTGSSGKTKLANTLMRSFGFPYFSIDHLMMGIYRSNKHCGFTPTSNDLTISKHLWPIILEMIKTNIENKHSIIIEGFQILPSEIESIPKEYRSNILSFFLTLSEEYIVTEFENISENRSIVETRSDIDDIETLIKKSKELQDSCIMKHEKCYVIRKNYSEEMNAIIKEISSNIDFNLTTGTNPVEG